MGLSDQRKYTIPVIRDRDGDLSKKWYVEFYFLNPNTGNMQRHQMTSGKTWGISGAGHKAPKKKERLQYFQELAHCITQQLANGWTPQPELQTQTQHETGIMAKALQYAAKELRPRTLADYTRTANELQSWMTNQGIPLPQPPSKSQILQFLQTKQHLGTATRNNYIRHLKALFGKLARWNEIPGNPAADIPTARETPRSHQPYSIPEASAIIQAARQQNPKLWLAILFVYYALMRPQEIRTLTTNDIDFEAKTIRITAQRAKTAIARVIPMHPDLEAAIIQSNPQNNIFDNGHGKPVNQFYFATAWNRFAETVRTIRQGQTMYSFKHTGAVQLYQATKDIYLVSRMCGHTSITTTEIYLRSLGESIREADISRIPSITKANFDQEQG